MIAPLATTARRASGRGAPLPEAFPSAVAAVLALSPPYAMEDLRPIRSDLGVLDAPGTLVCLAVDRPAVDVAPLRVLARDWSQRAPACPVIALLQVAPEAELGLANRLAPLGLRAVVSRGPRMRPMLRDALTDPAPVPRDVVEWLRLQGVRMNPNIAELVERIFALAPEHADLFRVLACCGIAQTTARFRMHKKGLPTPGRWFQAARALHAALRLQAEPEVPTTRLAHDMGFADHSALIHLLRRSFGLGSHEIRDTLGWEWLLHRWLTAQCGQFH